MNWAFFVIGAILCWGVYGPSLHAGQMAMTAAGSAPGPLNGVKALLWVGLAYFLVAVIVPLILLKGSSDAAAFSFPARGAVISTLAGILGAGGAVCIILSFRAGASPLYVMPLVFGGAPLINAVVTMIQHPPSQRPSPMLFVGMALAAAGGFMVLYFKPKG